MKFNFKTILILLGVALVAIFFSSQIKPLLQKIPVVGKYFV